MKHILRLPDKTLTPFGRLVLVRTQNKSDRNVFMWVFIEDYTLNYKIVKTQTCNLMFKDTKFCVKHVYVVLCIVALNVSE